MALIYKLGSRGETVKQIQRALAGAGYGVMVDGIYGSITEEAVRAFQAKNKLKVDGIVGPATFAALVPFRWKKSKRTITELIVHCTATPEYKDYTVTDIRQWHKAQGWKDIGYHYVVYRDGSVHEGRDVDLAGAHCQGHNANSIGICYVGGVATDGKTPKDTRTELQKVGLLKLLYDLKRIYPNAKIYGHRDFSNKACPSFNAKYEYRLV
jgi:N-acetylmuramoyl-L-alanine amidase